jgi:hypothetical protein
VVPHILLESSFFFISLTNKLFSLTVVEKILSLILSSFEPFGPFNNSFPDSILTSVSFGIAIGFFQV